MFMLMTERQLRNIIRKTIISEVFGTGMSMELAGVTPDEIEEDSWYDGFDPIQLIADKWDDLSEAIIEKVMEANINDDANIFYEGAVEGDADRDAGIEYDPDDNLRHSVFFQENLDYKMGYEWGYNNGDTWDGNEIPQSVMSEFIEEQIEEYKARTKTEITKDLLYTVYDNVSPNRIARKAYYPIKDAYNEGGVLNAIKKGLPLAMAIVTVEVLDQVVIPMVCLKMGIPPVTNAVGLGEAVYPILLPKLGGKEAIEFVEKYKEVSGNEEFYDDLN